jgi:hypothetical protein
MNIDNATESISAHASVASPSPPQPASTTNEPYSIFNKRQKGLIILIISTAATCEALYSLQSVVHELTYQQSQALHPIFTFLLFQLLLTISLSPLNLSISQLPLILYFRALRQASGVQSLMLRGVDLHIAAPFLCFSARVSD